MKNKFLGEEKISKLLVKFSIPCILSLLISALYNVVDQIFIGNSELGYLGNAATGVVFPLLIVTHAFAWCIGDGAAAYLSICQGKKDAEGAPKAIGTGITMTIIISVVLMVVFLSCQEPLLRLFGASHETIGMAMEYFTIVACFFPVYMFTNALNSVIRADGSPTYSMIATSVGAVVNIILDPVFIFGFGWGIKGAAWATVIGQTASFVLTLVYMFRTKSFKMTLRHLVPDFKQFGNAVQLGISSFITQMSIVAISLVCNMMLYKYGLISVYGPDIPISVISIETKVFTIVINIVVGIVLGAQPILGYNYGAGKHDRVRKTYKIVMLLTVAVGVISTLIFELCPDVVINLFGGGDELYMDFARKTFRIFLMLVTFTCAIKVSSVFFQAVGKPVKATVASLSRDIVCFIPLVIAIPGIFESMEAGSGITALLWASPVADLVAMIVTVILTLSFFKTLGKREAVSETADQVIQPSEKGVIITIGREHGSQGKQIGKMVASKLGIPFYYKEMTALAAQESGLSKEFISDINANAPDIMHQLYLSTNVVQQAVVAQDQIIKKIADEGSCVIVGRAADYVLRDYEDVIRVFIHAPKEYRIQKVMEMYGDSHSEAVSSIKRSDEARAAYYKNISGLEWGDARNYDLCVDSSVGMESCAEVICNFIAARK